MTFASKTMSKSSEYLSAFSDYLLLKNYALNTRESYQFQLERFLCFVRKNSSKNINAQEHAYNFLVQLRKKGLSWSAVNIAYSALVIFFKHTLQQDWDYQMTPRPKQAKRLPTILSHDEICKLINVISNPKQQTIIITLYATGLRVSELINLKLTDIYADRLQIKVTLGKGNTDRYVHINETLLNLLRNYYKMYKPTLYLFNGQNHNQPYSQSSITKILLKAAHKAGIQKRVHTHMIRHCFATHHLDFGSDIVYIKKQLGHRNLNVTAKYLHLCAHRPQIVNHPITHLNIHYKIKTT